MLEEATLEDREPNLDLIHPGCVLGRVNELKAFAMASIEPTPPMIGSVIVDVEVVPHDVDLLARIAACDLLHEADQCFGAAMWNYARQDSAGLDLERRQQCLGAVPDVLVLEAHRRI